MANNIPALRFITLTQNLRLISQSEILKSNRSDFMARQTEHLIMIHQEYSQDVVHSLNQVISIKCP